MLVWKNTKTLDGFDKGLSFTKSKEKANIALIGSKPINLDQFPNIKGLFRAGIGKDNVPEELAKEKGVIVRYPSQKIMNVIFDETASFTCSLIFRMLYNDIGTIDPWEKVPRLKFSKKKLLIIGRGKIGGRVYNQMKNFMDVISFDILSNKISDLKLFIQQAHCISIHIPKSDENSAFFNKEKLSWMKNNSVLINTARGSIVDEDALYNELKNKRIKAAFDVYWDEPYNGRLKELYPEYFYMTPHIASTCKDFLIGCRQGLDKLISDINE